MRDKCRRHTALLVSFWFFSHNWFKLLSEAQAPGQSGQVEIIISANLLCLPGHLACPPGEEVSVWASQVAPDEWRQNDLSQSWWDDLGESQWAAVLLRHQPQTPAAPRYLTITLTLERISRWVRLAPAQVSTTSLSKHSLFPGQPNDDQSGLLDYHTVVTRQNIR